MSMYKLLVYLQLLCALKVLAAKKFPTIVWWTNLLYPHLKDVSTLPCERSYCQVTKRRVIANSTDIIAFMFYGTDFNPEDLPFPRLPHHIWALLHEESPMNNFLFSHSTGIRLFNYTSTFSRHSDYPLTLQHLPSLEYLTGRDPVATSTKNYLRNNGLAPIIYVQSHCNIPSDRDRYVKELMKYIKVDSYGACLHNKDFPHDLNNTALYDSAVFFDFISQYKFHIAFENAICDDYITEKLFRPLHVGSVPIYRGSPLVKDWDPLTHSIIVAEDFKSPKELAAFIRRLDVDDKGYEKYLRFKNNIGNEFLFRTMMEREWGVINEQEMDFINGFECFLCDTLTRLSKMDRTTMKEKVAARSHMNCPQPRPSIELDHMLPTKDEWVKEDWPENYWFGLDQGKAVKKMIDKHEKNSKTFLNYLMEMKYNVIK